MPTTTLTLTQRQRSKQVRSGARAESIQQHIQAGKASPKGRESPVQQLAAVVGHAGQVHNDTGHNKLLKPTTFRCRWHPPLPADVGRSAAMHTYTRHTHTHTHTHRLDLPSPRAHRKERMRVRDARPIAYPAVFVSKVQLTG
jgi:hypothetical protein